MTYLPGCTFTAQGLARELGANYQWVLINKHRIGGRNRGTDSVPHWFFESGDVARGLAANPRIRPRNGLPASWREAVEAHKDAATSP